MVNRLAQESSLYLQQHKDNPVDWWPYSEEAFAEAKKLDRPIFLSIGYSSCFWCHEMSRESFDDKETADFLNSHFVNIKLDREEREDIDRIYQRYYNSYTGENGGWPLSVWMFPDGIPFHIGTYYPKNSGLLGKSFLQICKDIVKSWNSERNSLFETATALSRNIDSSNKILIDTKPFQIGIAQNEVKRLINKMDHVNGGFDSEPKFPRFYTLKFLLDQSLKLNNRSLMNFIIFTFQKMTKGGIYDQLGGGISRYSVDQKWLVPHFEKMLYDNAGLLELSINLFKITKDDYAQYIIQDLISFLFRVMYQGEFGFYSSVNAESEGIEGKYYVWDYSELEKFLGKNFEIAKIRYNLKKRGNFKDPRSKLSNANILSIVGSAQAISEKLNLDITHVYKILNEIKTDLFKRREQRIKPTFDKKLIITWNAMVFKSLIQTSYLLANDNLSNLVINSFNKLLDKSVKENYIARVIYPGSKEETSHISGILDDYAYLIDCLITFFEYTDNWSYIKKAKKLMNLLLSKFYNNEINILYLNEIDNQQNIGQIFHPMDDSFSSSFSITLQCLFKLGKYIEKPELIKIGEKIGQTQYGNVEKYDGAMNEYLFSLEYYLGNYKEFVIVDDDDLDFNKIVMNSPYLTKLIFRYNEKNKKDGRPFWDILEGRTNVKNSTIYICENNTCSLPIMNEEELNLFFKKDLETNS